MTANSRYGGKSKSGTVEHAIARNEASTAIAQPGFMVDFMFGGIAVAGNLLCVSYTDVRGKVFLVDLDDRRLVSRWSYEGPGGSYADAGGIAMDESFHVFVTDTANDMVRKFSAFGRELSQYGDRPQRGAGAASRDRHGTFDRPVQIAVRGKIAYVCCGERKLVRGVQRVDLAHGRMLDRLRAFGDSEGRFGAPRGIAVDEREVYVADTMHGVVQRFRRDGMFVCEVRTSAHHAEASRPVAVLPLPDGELLVADAGDYHGLRRIRANGRVEEVAAEFDEATDLASDDRGRIYVLDRAGQRVQRLTSGLEPDGLIVDLAEVGL